jgi:protein ImuA
MNKPPAMRLPGHPRRPDPALLKELRCRIGKLERTAGAAAAGAVAFGAAAIDGALPWGGLPAGVLNEVLGLGPASGFAAVSGFAAALAGRAGGGRGAVLWCRRGRGLYGPGLAALGLDPGRLIVVHGDGDADVLWAMEEGLRSGALAAVLGEAVGPPAVALRRLQLAAEAGGAVALLLRATGSDTAASPATTRWRVAAAPTRASCGRWPGPPRWRVELLKCRGGTSPSPAAPRSWLVEWRGPAGDGKSDRVRKHDETGGFVVAAELRHRSAEPAAGGGRAAIRRNDRHDDRLAV